MEMIGVFEAVQRLLVRRSVRWQTRKRQVDVRLNASLGGAMLSSERSTNCGSLLRFLGGGYVAAATRGRVPLIRSWRFPFRRSREETMSSLAALFNEMLQEEKNRAMEEKPLGR